MPRSLNDRLTQLLTSKGISPEDVLEIVTSLDSPGPEEVNRAAWQVLKTHVSNAIRILQTNQCRVKDPVLKQLHKVYIDAIVLARSAIVNSNNKKPIPEGMEHWQNWVPEDERHTISDAFQQHYVNRARSGNRTIPFAPPALRRANTEGFRRLHQSIANARREYGLPTCQYKQSDNAIGALMLCAMRMAELAIIQHEVNLRDGSLHPHENRPQIGWQKYCEPGMRKRVREALRSGVVADTHDLKQFYHAPDALHAPMAIGDA